MASWSSQDQKYMRLALDLAIRGQGWVEPNPMVGCVIARRGRIVGRGYHKRFGHLHAERNALRQAGAEARGATAYVTLEPCNHFGKTPPCTETLIRAGLKRVIVAMRDPNPLVKGRGLRKLKAAGIQVGVGLMRAEAMTLAAPFIKYHLQKRPYVIVKWAQSIDGKIATRSGESAWISSRQSRTLVHAIRARVDAVVVGVGTVLADNPALTARRTRPRRVATRVVLDPNLRVPLSSVLVKTAHQTPTLIVTSSASQDRIDRRRKKWAALQRAGCEIIPVRSNQNGIHLGRLLDKLHVRGMTNILVEGGGKVLGAFIASHLADEAFVFVAPILIGGEQAPGPLRDIGPSRLAEAAGLKIREIVPSGADLCYHILFCRDQ